VNVLAVIPARGGSKSVPNKNITPVGGKPLIAWTIEAALACPAVDRVLVTTDSPSISSVAAACGADVPFLRPDFLAGDAAPSIDAVLHALEWVAEHEKYYPDIVVALQPTSPLRTAADIASAIGLARDSDVQSVVSLTEAAQHPHWMNVIDGSGYVRDFLPGVAAAACRQDLPVVYAQNGAISLARRLPLLEYRTWFMPRTRGYIMPVDRSIDVDTEWDLRLADLILKNQ
jgi:CMP-N-acetylneuraminic acid synthetase